ARAVPLARPERPGPLAPVPGVERAARAEQPRPVPQAPSAATVSRPTTQPTKSTESKEQRPASRKRKRPIQSFALSARFVFLHISGKSISLYSAVTLFLVVS